MSLVGPTSVLRQLVRRPGGLFGIAILVVFTIVAPPDLLVGPLQTAANAHGGRLKPPSADFPFGTDQVGRSILNLTVHGTRISMIIGLLATVVTVFIGALVGIVSGFVGGRLDVV